MISWASSRNSCDEAEEAVQVHVVEGGLDLVHHVEGRRPGPEHGEQVRQRGERALATRQQRELLHVLARGLGLDLDAGVEQVVGLGEAQPALAARGRASRRGARSSAPTSAKAEANTLTISASTALMTLASSRRERLHVLELALEELVALLQRLVLLEGERVDRAHQPQLALELADPGHRRGLPSGSSGRSARHGGVGLDVEVAAQRLDRGLDAQLGLGLVELGPLQPLAELAELLLGAGPLLPQPSSCGGDRAGRLGLAAATLAQVDDARPRPRRAGAATTAARPLGGDRSALELDAAGLGGLPVARRCGTAAPRPRRAAAPASGRRSSKPAGRHLEVARGRRPPRPRGARAARRASARARARSARAISSASRPGSTCSRSGPAAVAAEPLVELGGVDGR